jgi:hypothetical protein
MTQLWSLAVFSLFIHVYLLPQCFSHAADALYETVFLVGPEPQPIILDAGESALDISITNGKGVSVNKPQNSDGGRKLNAVQTPVSARKPDGLMQSHSPVRSRNENNAAKVSRSLKGGECRITNTILGFNFQDNVDETGAARPPTDPQGAVGVSRLVAVGNSIVEVRQKDGTLLFRDGLQSFFSSLAASDSTDFYNPKVIYDEHKGRFVLVALQRVDSKQFSRIWVAISDDETPDAVNEWNQRYIDSFLFGGNVRADSASLEVDEEAVYIAVGTYRFSDSGYAGVRLIWFDKGFSSLRITDPFATAGIAATTVPAQVHGSNGVDGFVGTFFISAILKGDGQVDLQIYTAFNPLGSFTHTIQTVALGFINVVGLLPDAPQLGSSILVGTSTLMVLDAVWRNNKLWVVFTASPANGINQGQATAHWVRLNTNGGVVTFDAQGDLGGEDIATGAFTYFPSVAVNSQGMVAYGYSASSTKTYIGAYASVGTSETAYTLKSGLAPYATLNGFNEWGDYNGISVDPTDDSFWVFNQYADTALALNGRWATVWGRLECSVSSRLVLVLNVLSCIVAFF